MPKLVFCSVSYCVWKVEKHCIWSTGDVRIEHKQSFWRIDTLIKFRRLICLPVVEAAAATGPNKFDFRMLYDNRYEQQSTEHSKQNTTRYAKQYAKQDSNKHSKQYTDRISNTSTATIFEPKHTHTKR
jgi:hypothetical protein